jgi:lipopolysaccharide/colanic/teichoic acid biosynthesis glycosyltransferase
MYQDAEARLEELRRHHEERPERGDERFGAPPPLPSEVRQYKRWQRRRLSVKPGIPCVWQVSGRNHLDVERNSTIGPSGRICAKTITAVLGTRGAS